MSHQQKKKLLMIPGPTNVPERVLYAMTKPMINHRGEEFHELYKNIQEKARKVFETEQNILVLSSSGTGGVEAAISNIVKKGDNVIVPVFGEFSRRVAEYVKLIGGNAICVKAPLGSAPSFEEIKAKAEETRDIKAFCIVYNDTSPGTKINWLSKVASIASDFNAFTIVDAVSILAGDDLPMDKWNIDIVVSASQKCLAAPPGLAILGISEKAAKYIAENKVHTDYFNLAKYIEYSSLRKETPYTPAVPLFYALDEALNVVLEEGLQNRIQRHRATAKAFYESLEAIGLKPFVNPEVRSNTVISFKYPNNIDDKKFRKNLEEKFGVVIAGGFGELKGKIFRIGNMGEVNKYHVLITLTAIFSSLSDFDFKIKNEEEVIHNARRTLEAI
ncbi:MAG: alanine--glyoxylate aminotransferase family protein [Candidatus Brockarchaeota archaeon]|nr:alanine--glyoxylate aminotransferase family protein [Candidatus Brockarchaeota archaeon]